LHTNYNQRIAELGIGIIMNRVSGAHALIAAGCVLSLASSVAMAADAHRASLVDDHLIPTGELRGRRYSFRFSRARRRGITDSQWP
jgi:hypothetical protein